MNADDGTARFTPLDADGEPDGAPVVVPVSSMKPVPCPPYKYTRMAADAIAALTEEES